MKLTNFSTAGMRPPGTTSVPKAGTEVAWRLHYVLVSAGGSDLYSQVMHLVLGNCGCSLYVASQVSADLKIRSHCVCGVCASELGGT